MMYLITILWLDMGGPLASEQIHRRERNDETLQLGPSCELARETEVG